MTIKVRCEVCGGSGKVEGTFGGRCGRYDEKINCPCCNGCGYQEICEDKYAPWRRCRDRYVPYIPCPQPYPWYAQPTKYWSISSTDTGSSTCGGLNLSQSASTDTYTTVQ